MSEKQTRGGPGTLLHIAPSMSLRDYFAGQAMASLAAGSSSSDDVENYWSDFARNSYRIADAMLAEREREE